MPQLYWVCAALRCAASALIEDVMPPPRSCLSPPGAAVQGRDSLLPLGDGSRAARAGRAAVCVKAALGMT